VTAVVWRLALGLFGWRQGKESARELWSVERRRKRASLGGGSFFSNEGGQPAGLKEMGLGFCGCPNFLS